MSLQNEHDAESRLDFEPLVSRFVCAYLRWRYGGNFSALKPPLGYSKYVPRPLWYRVIYHAFLRPRWQAENWLFIRFGEPARRCDLRINCAASIASLLNRLLGSFYGSVFQAWKAPKAKILRPSLALVETRADSMADADEAQKTTRILSPLRASCHDW